MSAALERKAIGVLFNASWDADAIPVSWPNRDFTPPKDANWVRVVVQAVDAEQIEIGGQVTHRRITGLLMVKVFTPVDVGDEVGLALADVVASIFRGARPILEGNVGALLFREPTVREVGSDAIEAEYGAYYQVNVSIPYQRNNI